MQPSDITSSVRFVPLVGREYTIPSPLQRFLAETVDFFILFCVKATIVLWIMHLSGMKWVHVWEDLFPGFKRLCVDKPSLLWRDIAKFITHFIVEEIDENTSMEDLQKMMVVALVYRVLVCIYEVNLSTISGGGDVINCSWKCWVTFGWVHYYRFHLKKSCLSMLFMITWSQWSRFSGDTASYPTGDSDAMLHC